MPSPFSPVAGRLLRRSRFLGLLALAACSLATVPAQAQQPQQAAYPDHAIRLVVPYPPGGTADVLGRLLAERLPPLLGQPVIVENRAGGGTAIAARFVAAAPADGYTLFVGTNTSHAINPALQPDIGYSPVRDFTPIAAVSEVPFAIISHPSRGFTTLRQLVDYARAHPDKLNYSSAGSGSSNHLAGAMLATSTGTRIAHIPYKGSAPALNDLLGGQVDFMYDLATTAQQHVRAGRVTALATTGAQRSPVLPDVPTVAEAGFPDLRITSWFGVFAPAQLPLAVRTRLSAALGQLLAQPDTRQRLQALGMTVLDIRDAAFADFVTKDFNHWSAFVAKTGIKLD